MIGLLFSAPMHERETYCTTISALLNTQKIAHKWHDQDDDPTCVDYIVYAPNGKVQDFRPYRNVKLIQSTWAGVDWALRNQTLTQPLARMVDPSLTQGMVEYVVGHTLYHHLQSDLYFNAPAGEWYNNTPPPLASERVIGILGLGVLGQACAKALGSIGFQVIGWSRRAKQIANLGCYDGAQGLHTVLSRAEILILLLPATPQTERIINAQSIGKMRKGSMIINPGRGDLIDDTALLSALDKNHISAASLDTFKHEPLPKDHPYWTHPKVKVTPHIASSSRAETAAIIAAENIARSVQGETPYFLVNLTKGY